MALALAAAGPILGQVDSLVSATVTVPADATHDGRPFSYVRTPREPNHRYAVVDIRFPSPVVSPHPENNTVPAELYLPAGVTPSRTFPAVVCLHILNGNFDLERTLCIRLAQQGVIALFFKQPYYGERAGVAGKKVLTTGIDAFVGGLEQAFADTRRALDLLQHLPEVDPAKIGATGISMGAIQAARLCGDDPRVARVFLMLGGGNLRQIIQSARETRQIRAFIDTLPPVEQEQAWARVDRLDPLEATVALRKLSAQGRMRMISAERDQVIPPACSRALAEAAGCADRLTWLPGLDHYTAMASLPQILSEVVAFFGEDVPGVWQPPPPAAEPAAADLFGGFLAGLAAFTGGQPAAGTAHMVGLAVDFSAEGKNRHLSADFVRGGQGRFKLTGIFPEVGAAGLGQGSHPWLIGAGKIVFHGTQETRDEVMAGDQMAPERLLKFRMLSGLLGAAALSPEALGKYYTLAEAPPTNGQRIVAVRIDYKRSQGALDLVFAHDGTPVQAGWSLNGHTGLARFSHWRLNAVAPDTVFEPPAGLPQQAVRQEDLLRMFGAAFEFGMEAVE